MNAHLDGKELDAALALTDDQTEFLNAAAEKNGYVCAWVSTDKKE